MSDETNTYGEDIHLTTIDSSTIYTELITALEKGAGEPLYPGDERRIYGEALVAVFVALYNKLDDVGRPPFGREKLPEMQVITDAKELRKHTYKKVRNTNIFPKKDRLLADKMFDEAADLVADLMEANDHLLTDPEERELRFRAQRSALRNCRKLIDNIEFAHENLPGVTDDAFAFWSRLAAGVKNQTAAWYKKDRERAAKLVTKT